MSNISYDYSCEVSASSNDLSQFTNTLYQIQYLLSCLLSCDEFSWKLNSSIRYVYNPLDYAKDNYLQFLYKFTNSPKKLMFLGMNPGPWGMMQTGIPFGEVNIVRDWLNINGTVTSPTRQHPSRPIQGLNCRRSEVSGRRFWEFAKDISRRDPKVFFKNSFIYNYYPLALLAETGKNITPSDLKENCVGGSGCADYIIPNRRRLDSIITFSLIH